MKKPRMTAALLPALALAWAMTAAAYAAEAPDLTRTGSVTVEMAYGGQTVTGGSLALYRVGDVTAAEGGYAFALTEDFAPSGAALTAPETADTAAALWAFAGEAGLPPLETAENTDGAVVFAGLEPGLYLLGQDRAAPGYEALSPFCVSLPLWDGEAERYVYDVSASGKFQLQAAPATPAPSAPPAEPTLPQTGQLNWPVPVLAGLGLALLLLGWALRFGERKKPDET